MLSESSKMSYNAFVQYLVHGKLLNFSVLILINRNIAVLCNSLISTVAISIYFPPSNATSCSLLSGLTK